MIDDGQRWPPSRPPVVKSGQNEEKKIQYLTTFAPLFLPYLSARFTPELLAVGPWSHAATSSVEDIVSSRSRTICFARSFPEKPPVKRWRFWINLAPLSNASDLYRISNWINWNMGVHTVQTISPLVTARTSVRSISS